MKTLDEVLEWTRKQLPLWLLAVAAAMILATIFIQIGISHGRQLEREEMEGEKETLRTNIDALERAIVRLRKDALIAKVIECESSGRHKGVWGDGGKSYGIAQFQPSTFKYLAELSGIEGLNWKDREDQLWLLRWSIDNGYGHYWTCYRKLMKEVGD